MTTQGWLQVATFLALLTALTPLLGAYMARVYGGERIALERVMGPVERLFYRLLRVDPGDPQDWKAYARSLLVFSAVCTLALALAGTLAGKSVHPPGVGTLRTDTPTFGLPLLFVIVILVALNFLPALLLGPVVQGLTGQLF